MPFVFVDEVLETDVRVEDTDELVCVNVELEEVEEGVVDVSVLEEEDEVSLVGDADVLAGVDDELAAPPVDEVSPPVTPDNNPERAESTIPCRLLKTLCAAQLACVMANNTANIDNRCIWGRENIMMTVYELLKKGDENREGNDEEMGSLFAPSYSRFVRLSGRGGRESCF